MTDLTERISSLICAELGASVHQADRVAELIATFHPAAQPIADVSAPTDLSKRIRKYAEQSWKFNTANIKPSELIEVCDEIERYYGGMLAWKKSAEAKDAARAAAPVSGQGASLDDDVLQKLANDGATRLNQPSAAVVILDVLREVMRFSRPRSEDSRATPAIQAQPLTDADIWRMAPTYSTVSDGIDPVAYARAIERHLTGVTPARGEG